MIIVCPKEVKNKYLNDKIIHEFRFYNLEEIKMKIFFESSSELLYIVSKKWKVLPSIAKKMLENLFYIDNTDTKKLKNLVLLKNYLLDNNYLKKNKNFLCTLNEEIVIDGYPKTKELDIIINILSKYTKVTYKELKNSNDIKEIYEFDNTNDEIRFVCESILNLLAKGIDINKIVVINSNNDYIGIINKTFNLFKIPFDLNYQKSLILFNETKDFLNKIRNSSLKICELNEILSEIKNEEIKNAITRVLNKYYKVKEEVKELYDVIYFELKNTYLKNVKYENVVNIYQNIREYEDDFYVFCISLCEEICLKDNDYLSDFEKTKIGLNTSFELNEINSLYNFNVLSNIKNLTLSYKKNHNDNKYVINHLFENLERKKYEFLNNSVNYNKYLFETKEIFDNKYKKIDSVDLKKYLDNKLNLSYSSLDIFFKCKFRFLLNNILKIEPNIDTMSIKIGKMFHEILENVIKNDFNEYLKIIDDVSLNYLNDNLKEKFYKEKLKKEAIKIVERLKKIEEKSEFKNTYLEKYLETNLTSNIKLVGFIDKVLTYSDSINTYFIVVDYKTGNVSIDLKKLPDGFNMQLLIYLYLIKKNFKNVKIAGAYIDQILEELKPSVYGKKYEEIVDSKLQGITIDDKKIVKKIDNFYDINSFIKGIKLKSDGSFYHYSKVYSEKNFDDFLRIVEEKINEALDSILNCDFEINPKKYAFKDEIIGCEYCKFKEVCYMKYKDVHVLEGGDINEINC